MPDRAYLEIINSIGEVAFHALDPSGGITTIGQHTENHVVINHPGVAPFHAVLDYRQRPCQIILLSGGEETKLGGRPLSPGASAALHHGDTLEIAGHAIILLEEKGVAAKEPETAPPSSPVPSATAAAQPSPGCPAARERATDADQRPYYDFSLGELTPRRKTLSWFTRSAQVSIPITNNGNRETRFRLEGADEAGNCSFEFQAPGETVNLAKQVEFSVPPGETVFVPVRITPLRRRPVGLGKQTHFCTITTTMFGGRATRRTVLTQLQSAPLIGSGLIACTVTCLAVLAALMLQRAAISYATTAMQMASHENKTEIIASKADAGEVTYEEMFKEIAQEYDLDWRMLVEQAYRESLLDPLAIGSANEMGLMQILPSTWDEWAPQVGASDPWDPYSNVLVGAAYLAYVREYCSDTGHPGDNWALVAYNWGPDRLDQLFENDGGWAQVPERTRQYALDILRATEVDAMNRLAGMGTCKRLSVDSRQVDVGQTVSLPIH